MLKINSKLLFSYVLIPLFLFTSQYSAAKESKLSMDALIEMSLDELLNIEIESAGKIPEKIKDIPASVVIVSRTDIKKYGYTTLTDILENVPGFFNIYSYAGVSGNFGVRGFWNPNSQNSNIAILVNGISQIYDNDRTHPMEGINVPVEAIDRIEIIRGPMAVLYGNGASFGVINIITNEFDVEHQNIMSISYGSRKTKKSALRLSGQESDLKFVLNAGHFQSDGLNYKYKDMMSVDNMNSLTNYGINDPEYSTNKLLKQRSHYFGLSGKYKNWLFDVSYNQTEVGIFLLLPSIGNGHTREYKRTNIALSYETDFSSVIKFDFKANYSSSNRNDLSELINKGVDNSQIISFDTLEFEVVSVFNPNIKTKIVSGLFYRTMANLRDVVDAPSVGVVNESFVKSMRSTRAIYTQGTYQLIPSVKLIAGLRYEDLRPYNTSGITDGGLDSQGSFGDSLGGIQHTSGRAAMVYSFNSRNVFKFLYGEANRQRHDKLKPEITKTTEINYIYSRSDFFASMSLFHNKMENLVISDLVLENGTVSTKIRNDGKVSTKGLEVIFNSKISTSFKAELGVTLQDSDDKITPSQNVGYSPKTVAHGKLSYAKNRTTIAILGRYISGMETLFDLTKKNPDNTYGARIGDSVKGYYVIDMNFRQENIYKGLYLNLNVSNLLDQEIRYPNNVETNELLDKGTIGEGRTIVGSIGLNI